ncbi:LamB/YcsF family protein [Ornithinimicrobium faecis]|uniref:5-oxoprolinase subunit A n=1 Tax=Ornithinimicrobium faecis TaxID=2934158 RepID=A0ABY4YUJ7_9MICO|nr:5-oxoprolinase subunit PxpA [Ornithinimicrobium sp. HY1793]USQ80399.1 LamB/YcsF family protein [Ornithinimicrobium sp. HY1793]
MTVDLNSDLGEGLGSWSMGDDDALLSIVTSANVACGFHAGDPSIMRHVTQQAVANGVAIGAHVAYRDLTGFGRRFIDIDAATLQDEVTYQIGALDGFARQAGGRISYVKPHGGLYNTIVTHEAQAGAVVAAVSAYDSGLVLMGLPGSVVLRLAEEAGLRTAHEAFADRAYTPEGHLVSRKEKDSVLHDPGAIARRCIAMAAGEPIEDINGDQLTLQPDSICVHGDTPGAVEIARQVRQALEGAGVPLAPFAPAA